jgi:hypothetical protein
MGNITETKPKVESEAIKNRVGPDWHVRMTFPNGVARVNGFKSEAAARRRIKRESPPWLKRYGAGR